MAPVTKCKNLITNYAKLIIRTPRLRGLVDLGFIPLSVEEEADSLVDVPFVVEVDMEKKS